MSGLGSGLITISAMLGFIAACYWAYSRHNKQRWEKMGHLPLDDDQAPTSEPKDKETQV
jgi:cbb3-type cytochrome oxidase subunit 3